MKDKVPDRLFCRKIDRPIYDSLRKEGPFKGKELKEIFMMAMILGFSEESRIELGKGQKDGLIRIEYLGEEYESIINAIAIAEEGTLNVLLDKNKVYAVAEEYANAGIKMLKNKLSSKEAGSYIKKLESELREKFEKLE